MDLGLKKSLDIISAQWVDSGFAQSKLKLIAPNGWIWAFLQDKNFIGIANNVCKHFGASLTLLHVVPEQNKTASTIKTRSEKKLKEAKVKASVSVVKSDSPVETIADISASYDLLILGTPEKNNWIKVLFGGGKDKFTERAACSVLRLTLKD